MLIFGEIIMIKIETYKLLIIIASFCYMMTLISTFLIKTTMLNSMKILLGHSLIETYKLIMLSVGTITGCMSIFLGILASILILLKKRV